MSVISKYLNLKKKKFVFIYLAMLGLSCGMCDLLVVACTLSCSMWDLVSCPVIKTGPSTLGAQSLTQWATRKVPVIIFYDYTIIFVS